MKEARKEYGLVQDAVVGVNNFIHEITEDIAKFKGVEIVGQSQLCTVDMQLLDSDNNVLAQFGTGVGIAKDKHTRIAEGVEVRAGMKLKTALTSDVAEKICVTYILNEVQIPTFPSEV